MNRTGWQGGVVVCAALAWVAACSDGRNARGDRPEPQDAGPDEDQGPVVAPNGCTYYGGDDGDHVCDFVLDSSDCYDQYNRATSDHYSVVMVHDDWVGPGAYSFERDQWTDFPESYFPVGAPPGFDPHRPGLNLSAVAVRCGDERLYPQRVLQAQAFEPACLYAEGAIDPELCADAEVFDVEPLQDPASWTAEPAPVVALGLQGTLILVFERDLKGCTFEARLPDDLAHLPGTGAVTLCTDTYGLNCVPHRVGEPVRTIDGRQNPAQIALPGYPANIDPCRSNPSYETEIGHSGDFSRVSVWDGRWGHPEFEATRNDLEGVQICGLRALCGGERVAPLAIQLDWGWQSPCPPSYGTDDPPCEVSAHLDPAFLMALTADEASCAELAPAPPYRIARGGLVNARFDRDLRGCSLQVLVPEGDAVGPQWVGLSAAGASIGGQPRGPYLSRTVGEPLPVAEGAWVGFEVPLSDEQ
jgi:hypothetical protein